MLAKTKDSARRFTPRERFEIGYRMLIGHPYSEVAGTYGVSRSRAYELKARAETLLASMDSHAPTSQRSRSPSDKRRGWS